MVELLVALLALWVGWLVHRVLLVNSLRRDVKSLQHEVRVLRETLVQRGPRSRELEASIELDSPSSAAPTNTVDEPPTATATLATHSKATSSESATSSVPAPSAASGSTPPVPVPAVTASTSSQAKPSPLNLEAFLGGRVLLVAGIVVVLCGLAFFLKFAFDRNWIGPPMRIAMGAMLGVAALVGGEHVRRRG
ncbi:MAG: DUF2339 domain-containing protein, partial [Planctomycetes bacterium]|nr:DUF2339 domain-containing protein [Planctomycetota bacterium]